MRNIFSAEEWQRKMVFIRYNPDNYNKKRQNLTQADREVILIKWLKHYEKNEPDDILSVNYLFYDVWIKGVNNVYPIDLDDTKEYGCPHCNKIFYVKSIYDLSLIHISEPTRPY